MSETTPSPRALEQERSLAGPFLVCVTLLAMTWVVALYREAVTLRPWKRYQREYRELRLKALREDLRAAKLDLDKAKRSGTYRQVQAALSFEEARLRSDERYSAAVRRLQDEERRVQLAERRVQVERSRAQEIEYWLPRTNDERDRRELARLRSQLAENERELETWSKRKDATARTISQMLEQRDRARARLESFDAPIEELEAAMRATRRERVEVRQILIDETGGVDRCISCHVAADGSHPPAGRQPLTAHPGAYIYLEFHPPERFGCTSCHQGNGLAVSSVEKAHGDTSFWPEPLLRGEWAQSSCQRCHEELSHLRGAPRLVRGEGLLEKHGCFGCHKIAGFEGKPKIGPPLSRVATKVNYTWLVHWLLDPRKTQERSRMPNFRFTESEATAIADFLFSLSGSSRGDDRLADLNWERFEKGRAVYGEARCSICHSANGRGGTFVGAYAPDLSAAGSKLRRRWLGAWLESPRSYNPLSRMPRFRLSDEEQEALIEYLVGEGTDQDVEAAKLIEQQPTAAEAIERGRRLVEEFGCSGCHEIEGLERVKQIGPELKVRATEDKIGAELSTIGNKPLDLFDFGTTTIPRTRRDYLLTKLETPRIFRSDLRMPDFELPLEEREALVTLLLGFSSREMPRSLVVPKTASTFNPGGPAGALIRDLQCLTCHQIDGTGGDYAPDLSFEGSRARREWIESFVRSPEPLRPLLQQMPKFNLSKAEASTLAEFLSTSLTEADLEEETPVQGDPKRGADLYAARGCALCHQFHGQGGSVGPDLTVARRRLQPAYVAKHLLDPRISRATGPEPRYRWRDQELADIAALLVAHEGDEK